jgi:hypothetical protein
MIKSKAYSKSSIQNIWYILSIHINTSFMLSKPLLGNRKRIRIVFKGINFLFFSAAVLFFALIVFSLSQKVFNLSIWNKLQINYKLFGIHRNFWFLFKRIQIQNIFLKPLIWIKKLIMCLRKRMLQKIFK